MGIVTVSNLIYVCIFQPSNKIPWDTQCGSTKACYPQCMGGCDYLVTWQPSSQTGTGIQFDLKMILEKTMDIWIAVGLSDTGDMVRT